MIMMCPELGTVGTVVLFGMAVAAFIAALVFLALAVWNANYDDED